MCAANFESGSGQVVERDTLPGNLGVTNFAVGGETKGAVIRFTGSYEIAFVTTVAQMRCSGITFRMAFDAIRAQMGSPDLEFAGMLKSRVPPIRRYGGVARLAVGSETGPNMIGILSRREIALMAPLAIQGGAAEFLAPLLYVAGLAVHDGVYSYQCETARRVPLKEVLTVLPAMRRMTILTFYTELASVNIGVAIGTFDPDIGEFQILVTAKAAGLLVVSDQCESRFGMIELQRFSEGIPGAGGMTDLAIPLDITVGIRHGLLAFDVREYCKCDNKAS